jgi:1-acyl-sn-glycerol-3-phosphate acyltransferase
VIARLIAAAARLVSGARVVWTAGRPDERQRIYFANHTSHLDFVVLWSALPSGARALARPVAARDYWERGSVRSFLARKVFRAVLVDRGSSAGGAGTRLEAARRTIGRMAAELGDRNSLIVFPEGTRGSGVEPGPFKSGLYHLCRLRPDVELVPVYLGNMNRILPKGESLPVPMLSRIVFGGPLPRLEDEPKPEFLERARSAVCELRRR